MGKRMLSCTTKTQTWKNINFEKLRMTLYKEIMKSPCYEKQNFILQSKLQILTFVIPMCEFMFIFKATTCLLKLQ